MSLKNNHNKDVDVTILKFSPTNSPFLCWELTGLWNLKLTRILLFPKWQCNRPISIQYACLGQGSLIPWLCYCCLTKFPAVNIISAMLLFLAKKWSVFNLNNWFYPSLSICFLLLLLSCNITQMIIELIGILTEFINTLHEQSYILF